MRRFLVDLAACQFALLFAFIVSLQAEAIGQSDVQGFEITFPSMGTLVSLQTFSEDSQLVETVFGEAQTEIDRLVQIFSDYAESSEARTICQPANVGRWQKVSPEMWEVLLISDRWNRMSDGAFDASIGQLSILWRKARKQNKIPSHTRSMKTF
jgi:thiamine biosynthesis lipoprotein